MPRVGRNQVDQRAMRFAALVSAILLGLALILGPIYGLPPLAVQTFVFALGAILGLQACPYLAIYRAQVAPRRGLTAEPGPMRPQRFAQVLGMLLGITAMLAGLMGAEILYYVVTGMLFAAAALHAATGRCLGCDLYQRLAAPPTTRTASRSVDLADTERDSHDSHA